LAHRGAVFADFDGDGRVDIAVSSLGGPVELWHNLSAKKNHWIDIRLIGSHANRNGIGATVHIGNQWNIMSSAVSYASSSLDAVHFGLGPNTSIIPSVEVAWPDGTQQKLENIPGDKMLVVRQPQP
jgi:hypothetical protein